VGIGDDVMRDAANKVVYGILGGALVLAVLLMLLAVGRCDVDMAMREMNDSNESSTEQGP